MSDLIDAFEKAQRDVKTLAVKPDDATLLRLYALYKQGHVGNVQGEKPGFFDFVGAAKYEAWGKLEGISQDEAKQQYVDLVNQLLP